MGGCFDAIRWTPLVQIVEHASSALNDAREHKDHINANHLEMCRFAGPEDSGYRKVKDVLLDCLADLEAARAAQQESEF